MAEHYGKPPQQISDAEIRQYFLYLTNVRHLAPSSINVALYGIKFLYQHTLRKAWPTLDLVRPRRAKKLPVVLSQAEVCQILTCLRRPRYHVCPSIIYACGLRLSEGVRLQVKDLDSDRQLIHVRQGKGAKDRYVPLPSPAMAMLRRYWIDQRPCFSVSQ